MGNIERLLNIIDVENLVGYKKSKIYLLMADGLFPNPVRLGKRAVRWKSSDIDLWIRRLSASKSVDLESAKINENIVKNPSFFIGNGESFSFKFSSGEECEIIRVVDGDEIRTVAFLPNGCVINSTQSFLFINTPGEGMGLEIQTQLGDRIEKITISKDHMLITKRD